MSDCKKPVAAGNDAAHLLALIKLLFKEKQYDGVALLFKSNKEAERNMQHLPKIAMDIYHDICLKNLSDKTNRGNAPLYSCVENLLKLVAVHGPCEELLLELLELVEECTADYVFTSALKALQIVLLRQGNNKPRALEWCLNSIYTHLERLPVPDFLKEGYDAKQQQLLEQEDKIQNLLMNYITVGLFYDPLICVICSKQEKNTEIFRPLGITRRNVLCCFLIEMLGKPLSLLDLSNDGRKTNTYSLQCAKSLTQGATNCISDPLYLLSFIETRARFQRPNSEGVYDPDLHSSNIFLIDENLPLNCLAMYYYMVFAERVDAERIPLVYHPLYIMEACLYLVYELLLQNEPPLHEKALLLMQSTLQNIKLHLIAVSCLEIEIYKSICFSLCNLAGYSSHNHIRQLGVKVLRQYICCFEHEGKYLVIKNVLKSVNHQGIAGYLTTLYKDLVAEALQNCEEMPFSFCGTDFRLLLEKYIFQLPRGIETDLLEYSDKIIAALNVLRYFALKDVENRTGFWNFAFKLQETYLTSLRNALNVSVAHFKAELHNVQLGVENPQLKQLSLVNIDVSNDKQPKLDLQLDRNKKINILNQNLCIFDLMRSLLYRTCECLEQQAPESIKGAQLSHQLVCRNLTAAAGKSQPIWNVENENTTHPQYVALKLKIPLDHRSFHTKHATSTSIDDFRAKEEKREQDFNQQQKPKQQQEEDVKNARINDIRTKILEAALKHVPTLGWSRNAIIQGAEEAGYPSVVHGMFPEGGFDLVSYFNTKCNEELLELLQQETDNGNKQISNPLEFLVRFVRIRLEMTVPYKTQWPQALALIAMPQNAPTALAQVLTLVDDICYYSGDRSVDIAWYTRRIGLATILKMTELYMLQDNSSNHINTWQFLENRMDEVVQLQIVLQQTEDVKLKFQQSFGSAFITARNILGLNYNRP